MNSEAHVFEPYTSVFTYVLTVFRELKKETVLNF
jgi:hypothetical protein